MNRLQLAINDKGYRFMTILNSQARLTSACLTTDWPLPDDFLMTDLQLHNDSLKNARWLPDICEMADSTYQYLVEIWGND